MQSGVTKISTKDDKEVLRSAFVRLHTGISRRCRVLKEARDSSTFVVELDNRRVITVSSRHLWFEGTDSANDSSCVVCFTRGFLLSCTECGRLFHEDCSSMPRPKASAHSTATSFTCRDCFFMLYTARTGMENRTVARNNLLLIKEVKKYSTYAYRELLWDTLFRSNKSCVYCYCGGPGRYFNQMVQCLRCLQWFHRACLHSLAFDREILPWDCFWYFKCAHCNGSHGEVIRQLPTHWIEILHIAIMNLMAGKSRFCFVKRDIIPWLERNWEMLRPARKVTLSNATEENIVRHLQSDPARFQCGLEIGATRKEWRARCFVSGPVRQDLNSVYPVSVPVSQERLNDIALERGTAEDLPLLVLNPNARLPSMEIYSAIYGNKEAYRSVKRRFESARPSCYNRMEKKSMLEYRPDEDRAAWLSFPDPASLLRRRLHLTSSTVFPERRNRKRKSAAPSQASMEKKKSANDASRFSDVQSLSEMDNSKRRREMESSVEKEDIGTLRRKGRKPTVQEQNSSKNAALETAKANLKKAVVSEVELISRDVVKELEVEKAVKDRLEVQEVRGGSAENEQLIVTCVKVDGPREKSGGAEKSGKEHVETVDGGIKKTALKVLEVEGKFDAKKTTLDDSSSEKTFLRRLDKETRILVESGVSQAKREFKVNESSGMKSSVEKTKFTVNRILVNELSSDEIAVKVEEKGVNRELPTLRPRNQGLPPRKSRQVARKSGRPLPLCQPSPPPKVRTRMCSIPLVNIRNWYEITGDTPPRTCNSGSHVLQTIPTCLSEHLKSQPFLYRWEVSSKPRFVRSRLIRRGLPARHATSTPLKPQNPRKKSEYGSDGVVTVLAKRRQCVLQKKAMEERKNLLLKETDEPLQTEEEEEEFDDLLLLWNRKLVKID